MRINVHIERLILDGLPVTSLQGPEVGAAIETELARLLLGQGLSDELRQGATVSGLKARAIQIGKDSQPARIAQSISRTVYDCIGCPKTEKAPDPHFERRPGVPR
jgi:hypothetical protein